MPDVTSSNYLYPSYLVDSFRGGVFEPQNHVLKMGLARISYVPSPTHMDLADVSPDELAGNGYSRQTLQNVLIVQETDWIKLSFDPVQFGASGGNLSGKYWFLFDDTPGPSPLMAWGQIDIGREDEVVIVDGKTLDIVANDLGLYRVPAWAG